MKSVQTKGIILSRRDYGEADRILNILTEHLGKISAIAKGSRKLTSRKSGHLELGNLIDFELAPGKNLYVITAAKTTTHYRYDDLKAMQALFLWLEILDHVIPEKEPNSNLFDLAKRALDAVAEIKIRPAAITLIELELYSTIGFQLNLDKCVVGQEVLKEDGNAISLRSGGVLCGLHSDQAGALPVSSSAIKMLRLVQKNQWDLIDRVTISDNLAVELNKIVILQRHEIIEKKLKSEQF